MLHVTCNLTVSCGLAFKIFVKTAKKKKKKNSPEDLGSESEKSWDCEEYKLPHFLIRTSALVNSEIGVSSTIDGVEERAEKMTCFS